MARLTWSDNAIHDLNEICAYISRTSEVYARTFAAQVREIVESIPAQPLREQWSRNTIKKISVNDYVTTIGSFTEFEARISQLSRYSLLPADFHEPRLVKF